VGCPTDHTKEFGLCNVLNAKEFPVSILSYICEDIPYLMTFFFFIQVFRFTCKDNGGKLPYHQFAVGDSVRITAMSADPLNGGAIEGVLMERRQRYLDICLSSKEASGIDTALNYRVDSMVNRVTYDRQIEALQQFLQPSTRMQKLGISRVLRDIMLYSYPNSLIQLANTPGGLKMALPRTGTTDDSSLRMGPDGLGSVNEELEFEVMSKALEKGMTFTDGARPYKEKGSEDDDSATEILHDVVISPQSQLQQKLYGGKTFDTSDILGSMSRDHSSTRARDSEAASGSEPSYEPTEPTEAVFTTNSRLKTMAENYNPASNSKLLPYDDIEVEAAVRSTLKLCPMNESQIAALERALHQTVTLIQGPPGTGKTRTACAILATIVELKKQRLLEAKPESNSDELRYQTILACAHSNVAADNLLEGLLAQGVKAVRLGECWTGTDCCCLLGFHESHKARTVGR
jgi:AAA domain